MKTAPAIAVSVAVFGAIALSLYKQPADAQQPVEEFAPTLEACIERFVVAARSEHGAKLGNSYCQRNSLKNTAQYLISRADKRGL